MMVGIDYGTRPRIMVVGDLEFPGPLQRSFDGLGYIWAEGPAGEISDLKLAMLFSTEADARLGFSHFKQWTEGSGDGDAVGISFVEYANGEYAINIFQEMTRLFKRSLGPELLEEVEALATTSYYRKRFPRQNAHYHTFKEQVRKQPFQLLAATKRELLHDLSIDKRQVDFITEHEIATDRATLFGLTKNGPQALHADTQSLPKPTAQQITRRREEQLTRFFPITLERLRRDKSFADASEQLKIERFSQWQINQAACNIALQVRVPHLFVTGQGKDRSDQVGTTNKVDVLRYLLEHFEDITVLLPQGGELTVDTIRAQALADGRDLLDSLDEQLTAEISSAELLQMLAERGLK